MNHLDAGSVILRSTIEAALEAPLSVAVTSARPADGKTAVAAGLARAFSEAGYPTIVIDANPLSPGLGAAFGGARLKVPATLDDLAHLSTLTVSEHLDAASIADETLVDSTSAGALRAFMDELRARYAVTIWDASDLYSSPLAVQCAAAADGVVLAVRFGRNPAAEDARTVATLEQVGARILGVVTTGFPSGTRRNGVARAKPSDAPAAASIRRAGKSIA